MNGPSGILVVNKPAGITSHDVVYRVRRKLKVRKVGHAGTLDPAATGVLVVLVGEATKRSEALVGKDKEYEVKAELGWTTESLDTDGEVTEKMAVESLDLVNLDKAMVEAALVSLVGEIVQETPAFSAVKRGGRKLYEMARKGEKVERPKRQVVVYELSLKEFEAGGGRVYPRVSFGARVSSGTYTRSLVESLGRSLGVPAVQTGLVRRRVGEFKIEESVDLAEWERSDDAAKWLKVEAVEDADDQDKPESK